MITLDQVTRVADGGICNSLAAGDMARVVLAAVGTDTQILKSIKLLNTPEYGDRTYTSEEVQSLLRNIWLPMNGLLADCLDSGDGRSLRQVHEDEKAAAEGEK